MKESYFEKEITKETTKTWAELGFSPETESYLKEHFSSPVKVEKKIQELKYANVINLLSEQEIKITGEELEKKLSGRDELEVVTDFISQAWPDKFPSKKELIKKISQAGFTNPLVSIEKFPPLAGYDIQRVINDLKKAGFTNPLVSIEKFPPLAGYDIQRVINDLKKAGFTNPLVSIEKFPQLAGLDIQRVKRRLNLISKLHTLYQIFGETRLSQELIKEKSIELIEDFPPYLGYSQERIFFYLRLAKLFKTRDLKIYKRLITKNPFLIFQQITEQPSYDSATLRTVILSVGRMKPDRKKQIITEMISSLPSIIRELSAKPQPSPSDKELLKIALNLKRILEKPKRKKRKT